MDYKYKKNLKILNELLTPGRVVTSSYLESIGMPRSSQKYYYKSGFLERIGRGAYKKTNDKVQWQGAVNAIQKQKKIKVHLGGLSALAYQGFSHYSSIDKEILQFFSPIRTLLPKWFLNYDWGINIQLKGTSFLPYNLGLKEIEINQIPIIVSSPERAIMECLYLSKKQTDLIECYKIFKRLVNLEPKLVMELLQKCNLKKIKRLFLYMAEKSNHSWVQSINTNKIDIGNGNILITKNSVYISKYQISIPKKLVEL